MRVLKVFFFGTGQWSKKYFENITSKFSDKIEILTIITNNPKFKHPFFNTEYSLNEALKTLSQYSLITLQAPISRVIDL